MDLHPTIDVLITAGRDSTARVIEIEAHTVMFHKLLVLSGLGHAHQSTGALPDRSHEYRRQCQVPGSRAAGGCL